MCSISFTSLSHREVLAIFSIFPFKSHYTLRPPYSIRLDHLNSASGHVFAVDTRTKFRTLITFLRCRPFSVITNEFTIEDHRIIYTAKWRTSRGKAYIAKFLAVDVTILSSAIIRLILLYSGPCFSTNSSTSFS